MITDALDGTVNTEKPAEAADVGRSIGAPAGIRVVTGTDTIFIKADRAGITSIGVKGFQIPTDRNGQLWVHFAHYDPTLYVSAASVLDGSVAPEKIKGKLILVGTSAGG